MIKFAIENPIKIFVIVLLLIVFGVNVLISIPYRLIPPVESPQITITTSWSGATPYNLEKDIIDPQERKLRSISGLTDIESKGANERATVGLLFDAKEDINNALLKVLNKLSEVPSYPENVNNPIIKTSSPDGVNSIIMHVTPIDKTINIDDYGSYIEEVVRPYFDRIKGVSNLRIVGGLSKELQIKVNPEILALYGLTVSDISKVFAQENLLGSAGTIELGKKDFRVVVDAQTNTPEIIKELVVLENGNSRVKIADIAEVSFGNSKKSFLSNFNGQPSIYIGIIPEANADILTLTKNVREIAQKLNDGILREQNLKLNWYSDQEGYILDSLALVKSNILAGLILAMLVILIFLRSIRSTIVIGTAIPISIMGTIIVLGLFGRSLNIISLAGIAFCIGMLIDNSIVVLENIHRHIKMGKNVAKASYDGVREVWGAVLISTLTTIAVFLPVIFIKEEAGQLFSDIALSVSTAVGISLVVSVLVIPSAISAMDLSKRSKQQNKSVKSTNYFNKKIDDFGLSIISFVKKILKVLNHSTISKIITISAIVSLSVISLYFLVPKMDYLPTGNQNLVRGQLTVEPGLSVVQRTKIGQQLYSYIKEYQVSSKDGFPQVDKFSYFSGVWGIAPFITAKDKMRASELKPILTNAIATIPSVSGSSTQLPIFNIGRDPTNVLVLYVVSNGPDYVELAKSTRLIQEKIQNTVKGSYFRVDPNSNPIWPELNFYPNREALASAKLHTSEVQLVLDAFVDGSKISEITDPQLGAIDIVLKGNESIYDNPEQVKQILVSSPNGVPVPLSNLTTMVETMGLEEIVRYNSQKAFKMYVFTQGNIVLEELINIINTQVVAPLKEQKMLDGIDVIVAGVGSKLKQAQGALLSNLVLAIIITYLLMSALFNNFLYSLIILITLPFAVSGGFLGLFVTNKFIATQPFDILSMLGFIMLIGIVVNNAILIVHQSIVNYNEHNMEKQNAIDFAVETRLRPIAMSTLSSLFGMLPLIMLQGSGSELYRGLGSVIVGGMTVASIFTIFVIPALLSFVLKKQKEKVDISK